MSSTEFQDQVLATQRELLNRQRAIEEALRGTLERPQDGLVWQVKELKAQLDARPCQQHAEALATLKQNQNRALAAWGIFVVCGAAIGSIAWQWVRDHLLKL